LEQRRTFTTDDFSQQWPPEERESFLLDWNDDEPLLQMGRGEKRSFEDDGAETSTAENNFTVTNVKQVKVKKFGTTSTDYTVQFTDTFARLELSRFHDRLRGIFESLLDTITRDIPEHDQVRFVLHSPQLEKPIMTLSRLTTERVLAQIERVIQSNHEFRLIDSVEVNLVHVEMPNGGRGSKRFEINLEKHLINKKSIVRIQNKDDLCLARALVVSIAKIGNDSRYKSIVDHRRPM
jgi:hypothetical protein